MAVRRTTPLEIIQSYMEEQVNELEELIATNLMYVGERCVVEARTNGSYTDQTGNLRSSIGYVVLKDGVAVSSGGFQTTLKGGTGSREGKAFLEELTRNHRTGIVLIVVAGMNYAAYVEALNYIVIDSAQLLAERLVPQIMKQLGFGVR